MTETDISMTGTILHLQRLSTEDGPGIRTTVFYKGCPLRCAWCHNPESLLPKRQVQWMANRCIGCDSCIEVCREHALLKMLEGIARDRTLCSACGKCAEACPSGAMEMLGEEITVGDLVNELVKDRAYFEKSGGGVTLSGGEPSMQPAFTLALMRAIREKGLNIALDTCGLCATETLEKLVNETDHVLFDIKLIKTSEHEQWTGVGNEHILENLVMVKECVQASKGKKRLWIRTPLIPKATDHLGNIQGIGKHLASHLNGTAERWELSAFNNLCRDKYQRLGMEWTFAETPLMSADDLKRIDMWAKETGFNPDRVFVTGATRIEDSHVN
jgi:pyruvate formate lyase activating enzyme